MAIVAQYSKTSAIKGHDTLIPHILDAFCQEIAKVIVFQTHLFAEQIVSILFPGQHDLLTLWRTNLFVKFNHLFTTEDLSGVLRVASLKTIDIRIGVWDYYQLSVCLRHAHCPKLDKLTMSLDDEDPASLQAATEERLYGVSTGYLGKLPENMVEPFARASGEWQHFIRIPEGGTEIKLREFTVKEVWKRYLAPIKTQTCCYCICHRDVATNDSKIPHSRVMQNPQEPLVKPSEPRQSEEGHDIPSTAIVSSLPLATESVFDTVDLITEVMSYFLYGFNY